MEHSNQRGLSGPNIPGRHAFTPELVERALEELRTMRFRLGVDPDPAEQAVALVEVAFTLLGQDVLDLRDGDASTRQFERVQALLLTPQEPAAVAAAQPPRWGEGRWGEAERPWYGQKGGDE